MQNYSKTNQPLWFSFSNTVPVFLRAQVSAFTGGICDYLLMIFFTSYMHIFYGYSILISGALGAVINFNINRYWTFKTKQIAAGAQLQKFVVVVAGSILLKSTGTYLLTELLRLDYRISRLCVDAFVSFGFNYTLQKYWVFKR